MSSSTQSAQTSVSQPQNQSRFGISPAQVGGSALAAASAAFASSYLGVGGTIIGAALVSVVATVGSAWYTASLRRGSAAVVRTAQTVRTQPLRPIRNHQGRVVAMEAVGAEQAQDSLEAADDGERGEDFVPADETGLARLKALPWKRLALTAASVLVVVILALTALELVTGRTLSSLVGGSNDSGTTLGHVVGGDSSKVTPAPKKQTPSHSPAPAPSPSSTPTPSQTPTPTPTPSQTPTTSTTPVPLPSSSPSSARSGASSSTPPTP